MRKPPGSCESYASLIEFNPC